MVRFKNRYLYAEYILFPADADDLQSFAASPAGLAGALRTAVVGNFGQAAGAKLAQSLSVKYFNAQLRCALVRCARDALAPVWFAINCLPGGTTDAQGRRGRWAWRVLAVSGSIRGCQKGSLRSIRHMVRRKLASLRDDLRPEADQWRSDLASVLKAVSKQLQSLDP